MQDRRDRVSEGIASLSVLPCGFIQQWAGCLVGQRTKQTAASTGQRIHVESSCMVAAIRQHVSMPWSSTGKCSTSLKGAGRLPYHGLAHGRAASVEEGRHGARFLRAAPKQKQRKTFLGSRQESRQLTRFLFFLVPRRQHTGLIHHPCQR